MESAGPVTEKKRHWFTWRRAVIAIALLAAFGVGTAAAGGTKTVTKTVTKTQTVTKTPSACTAAITDARQVAVLAGRQFGRVATLFPLVSQAAAAGASGDTLTLNSIAAKLRSFTAATKNATGEMTLLAGQFNSHAASCR